MTKFKGAHSEPLFTLLRTGMYTLKGDKSELADRATLRQVGTVPRHKSERSQIRDGTSFFFFFVHMVFVTWSIWSIVHSRCVIR